MLACDDVLVVCAPKHFFMKTSHLAMWGGWLGDSLKIPGSCYVSFCLHVHELDNTFYGDCELGLRAHCLL